MATPLGVILCGTGEIAATHVEALRASGAFALRGIAGHDPERTRSAAARWSTTPIHDLDDALRSDAVDAVVVASATDTHLDQLRRAVVAGKHALVEKPFALDVEAATALAQDVKARGLVLAGVFQRRFLPIAEDLRAAFASGALGRAIGASAALVWKRHAKYFEASPWRGDVRRAGGGVFMMQGIHTIDLMRFVLGEIDRIDGKTARIRALAEVEDTAAVDVRFRCGAVASLFATTAAHQRVPQRIAFHFEAATVELVGDVVALDTRREPPRGLARWLEQRRARRAATLRDELFVRVAADFAHAIRTRSPPRCDAFDALASVAAVQSLYGLRS
ncbi:MAG: Gfo/Idh/MocA family oxidoreductase [Planctomycetes bacterium]|nr:Gfo/Idh/MocA family oxidoreductase [Planctomycetota bacterium]MCC7172839.1 Gfo/Idh/MocA family oxidoreductase [Planctomycetota bacterium]